MAKLSDQYKLAGRSVPEIWEPFQGILASVHARKLVTLKPLPGKRKPRKVTAEAMTNAVVLHFLDLAGEERDRILLAYIPKYDDLITEDAGGHRVEKIPPPDEGGRAAPRKKRG